MASHTPHVVIQELLSTANVTMLSIVEPTYQAIKEQGYTRIACLGTKFTMEQPFFREIFKQNGITVIIPDKEERQYIDTIIAKELEYGIVNQDSKQNINRIIHRLINEQQIQAVILGCTELSLMYQSDSLSIPIYDTLQYHIEGILSQMRQEEEFTEP